ncbi:MAG: DMT family transporter [Rhodospirillales bacterium]|nr:MAG: DMT family transporter [Rhodospirillales bacterium]
MAAVPTSRALPLVILLAILWGGSWPMFNIVLRDLSVWTFRAIAVTGAGVLLIGIAAARRMPLGVPRAAWPALAGGAMGTITVWYVAATAATLFIPSGQASVLGYTMPLWAALAGTLFLGERLSGRVALALVFGAATVGFLAVPNLGKIAGAPAGIGCALLAGIGWAAGTLIQKRADWRGVPPLVLTAWQMLIGAVPIIAGAALFAEWRWTPVSTPALLSLIWLTAVPTAVGTMIWFRIVHLLPANIASLSTILVPVVAVVGGVWAHGEPFGPWQALALASAVAALALALLRPPAES